jgi:hypothetical protein
LFVGILHTMGDAWSEKEVQVIVEDYFDMLSLELQGTPFKKSDHRNELLKSIDRSPGSIEYKHQNISAVLLELGMPYIAGYKPARNYQKKVFPDIVLESLLSKSELIALVEADVSSTAVVPTVRSILDAFVSPPDPRVVNEKPPEYVNRSIRKIDYLAREASNASLGSAGEEFVINYEKARLIYSGKELLADRIEQVSETKGDGEGYDILSYNDDGSDRFIEAKTTKYGIHTPFFITTNEVEFSRKYRENYHLYRVFEFRESPKLFTLDGFVGDVARLEPRIYTGRV